ncbi:hybrid sensor histidine kinase/response regulator [Halotalea alkalilenta]|uniref:hybrid sensor histidine kinase/response regulator n=1 Tax=Halotalea alkalilenta TaxID=376489 RepID=UPI0004834001|nr:response regulator [Halotalea alkalilenta]
MNGEQSHDETLMELFQLEAQVQLQAISDGLIAYEHRADDSQLAECMRCAHALKGAARIVGYTPCVELAHAIEEVLVAAQGQAVPLGAGRIDLLLRALDLMKRLAVPGAEVDGEELARVCAQLGNHALAQRVSAAPAAEPAPLAEAPPASAESIAELERYIRIAVDRLDDMQEQASQALVETQRLASLVQRARRVELRRDRLVPRIEALGERLGGNDRKALMRLFEQLISQNQQREAMLGELDELVWGTQQQVHSLYEATLVARMRPVADLTRPMARMVRDLARQLGKRVELIVEGESTLVDRNVLERLEAPMVQLLRNALDHGIEAPSRRLECGKPEIGRLQVRVRHHAGQLLVEVEDDGAGLDLERLRERVEALGLADGGALAGLDEAALVEYLFTPGFSLRDAVNDVSGRGVGLDVVRQGVERIRGRLELRQRCGQGCRFILRLPLSLSLTKSLLLEILGESYALPLMQIDCVRTLDLRAMIQLEGRAHFWLDDELVPLASIHRVLQLPEPALSEECIVIVMRNGKGVFGVLVERILGERTLVAMPLDPRLGKVHCVVAGAQRDDGGLVLILDADEMQAELVRQLGQSDAASPFALDVDAGDERPASKRVLVVDDSLTVRELLRKLLISRGYGVSVAEDGLVGWQALEKGRFDLLITDLDMPRMDGIELMGRVRACERLASLPIMVVSYKNEEADRLRGLEAGADYYLAKPAFHDDTLLEAVAMLLGGQ